MTRQVIWSFVLALALAGSALAGQHRLGGGVNYWRAVKDLAEEFDQDGLSYLVSYQFCPTKLFRVEANVEFYPDYQNTGKDVYAPQAFALLGGAVYGGVGAGWPYFDGEWTDDPIYALRAGVDLEVLPEALHLDIYGRYEFTDWADIDIDSDTVMLGGAVRFEF